MLDEAQHGSTGAKNPVAAEDFPATAVKAEIGASTAKVLLLARDRIRREGWWPTVHATRWRLFDALWDQPVTVARWNAVRLVGRFIDCHLPDWDAGPLRTKGQALRVLNAALEELGIYTGRRRGPACSMGPGRPLTFQRKEAAP